jgi:inner membrane transporter RhtA
MATAMISVQAGAAIAKGLFPAVGVESAVALRVIIAALILAALFRPWRRPPARRHWAVLAAYGVSLGLMNLTFYAALTRIPLGVAVAVEFAGPLGVAVLASRRVIDFLWIGLAACGLLALSPFWSQGRTLDPLGVWLALGAGLFWGLYIVFGKAAGGAHGTRAAATGMAIAALVVLPAGVAHASTAILEAPILVSAVGVAVLSSVLPYSLEMFALTRIPVRIFGTLMSLEPAVAALMGWLILGETLATRQVVAIAAIITASLGVTLAARPEREPPAALTP